MMADLQKKKSSGTLADTVQTPTKKSKTRDKAKPEHEKKNQDSTGREESDNNAEKLFYRLKAKKNLSLIKEVDGKMECPFCLDKAKNIYIHFSKKKLWQQIGHGAFFQPIPDIQKEQREVTTSKTSNEMAREGKKQQFRIFQEEKC